MTVEVYHRDKRLIGGVKNSTGAWTINDATFDTIPLGEHQAFPIIITKNGGWPLDEKLSHLEKDFSHEVLIRVCYRVFEDDESKVLNVWTGYVVSPFYKFRFRIRRNRE